ncbi:hypothetical protein B5181_40370, partial [Streptomyces sp. 4F]
MSVGCAVASGAVAGCPLAVTGCPVAVADCPVAVAVCGDGGGLAGCLTGRDDGDGLVGPGHGRLGGRGSLRFGGLGGLGRLYGLGNIGRLGARLYGLGRLGRRLRGVLCLGRLDRLRGAGDLRRLGLPHGLGSLGPLHRLPRLRSAGRPDRLRGAGVLRRRTLLHGLVDLGRLPRRHGLRRGLLGGPGGPGGLGRFRCRRPGGLRHGLDGIGHRLYGIGRGLHGARLVSRIRGESLVRRGGLLRSRLREGRRGRLLGLGPRHGVRCGSLSRTGVGHRFGRGGLFRDGLGHGLGYGRLTHHGLGRGRPCLVTAGRRLPAVRRPVTRHDVGTGTVRVPRRTPGRVRDLGVGVRGRNPGLAGLPAR